MTARRLVSRRSHRDQPWPPLPPRSTGRITGAVTSLKARIETFGRPNSQSWRQCGVVTGGGTSSGSADQGQKLRAEFLEDDHRHHDSEKKSHGAASRARLAALKARPWWASAGLDVSVPPPAFKIFKKPDRRPPRPLAGCRFSARVAGR